MVRHAWDYSLLLGYCELWWENHNWTICAFNTSWLLVGAAVPVQWSLSLIVCHGQCEWHIHTWTAWMTHAHLRTCRGQTKSTCYADVSCERGEGTYNDTVQTVWGGRELEALKLMEGVINCKKLQQYNKICNKAMFNSLLLSPPPLSSPPLTLINQWRLFCLCTNTAPLLKERLKGVNRHAFGGDGWRVYALLEKKQQKK